MILGYTLTGRGYIEKLWRWTYPQSRRLVLAASIGLLLFVQLAVLVQAGELTDQALSDYDAQLDVYRGAYDEFVIARRQFEQANSFANQEELVVAARDMLVSRSRVWWSYWQTIRSEIVEAQGFDPTIKADITSRIEAAQTELKTHEETVATLRTREELLEEAEWLNEKQTVYTSLAYEALLQLRFARINWALVQLEEFVPLLKTAVEDQIRDPQELASRLRGLNEADSLVVSARNRFAQVQAAYSKRQVRNYAQIYDDVVSDLPETYSDIRRLFLILQEVSEGTEL